MRHAARSALAARHPVLVTTRLCAGLPSLRSPAPYGALLRAMRAGADRFGFRLVHHSVQSNHLHLIAEAADARALARGLQALLVRIARALNRLWKRAGRVFADRYHVRQLRTPREVRHALVYVLHNARKHNSGYSGVDPYTSGPWFAGWRDPAPAMPALGPPAGIAARTWLLTTGWQRHGRIGVRERPAS